VNWVQNVQAVQAVQNVWNDLNYLNGTLMKHKPIVFHSEGSPCAKALDIRWPIESICG
jgi:hypothetical protein